MTPAEPSLPVTKNQPTAIPLFNTVIPKPVSVTKGEGVFTLTARTRILCDPDSPSLISLGQYLAQKLSPATGYQFSVASSASASVKDSIYLTLAGGDPSLGEEGYELTITPERVRVSANQPAGVFYGLQTIRQLLPASVENSTPQVGPWQLPAGKVRDYPRLTYRGVMLDVARHFFGVADVKRLIDLIAYYKMNWLHLHLADDQGWRLMINSWPNLALHGGSTQVGGGKGGYYTQVEYADLVAYAQSRYVVIVPEIDTPGHTNAALSSYAELNCDGVAPSLFTETKVGFSTLCISKEITYKFLDDVVREIAALTPSPYIHLGGDEAHSTKKEDYLQYIEKIQPIVEKYGKHMIGWEEIAQCRLLPGTVVQYWSQGFADKAIAQGARLMMSPSNKAYVDMKYDASTPLGLSWAGFINVQDAYTWDPATLVSGVAEDDVLGLEATLWSETVQTMADVEYMLFPRVPGYAEIGWSPAQEKDWNEYRSRLTEHGARLDALGVNFYRSKEVPDW